MKIMVTGGAGYVGSYLIPHLLADGHRVVCFDTFWFGDGFLPKDNERLTLAKGDIRDAHQFKKAARACDAVIHLACISNDTQCNLDPALSTSINFDCFPALVKAAKDAGVRRFIFASSSSVYGFSDEPQVYENHPLKPMTLYNKYKGLCEPLLLEHCDRSFTGVIVRPATVCGYAPRMRFDLTANILTMHAVRKGVITVFGGRQKRPHLHIKDMVNFYKRLLDADAKQIQGEAFNIGAKNMTVLETAEVVQAIVPEVTGLTPAIDVKESTDDRSYHINSDKAARVLGFKPAFEVGDAVRDIAARLHGGQWPDALTNKWYTNLLQYAEVKAA